MAPRILLADDHLIVREGIKALLERHAFVVAGEAADGRAAVQLAAELKPDLAVLDVAMPLLNGIDAARSIHTVSPRTRCILLTMHTDDHYVIESLTSGIQGYVLKTRAVDSLLEAIREVMLGDVYITPEISRSLIGAFGQAEPREHPLSLRERQVIQLIAESKTTKEIAVLLNVSVKTVDSQRSRLMEKLGIHDTAALVRYAIRRGIIRP